MVATLKVDRIQKVNSDSDSLVFHDTGITLNKPLTDASGEALVGTSISGSVLQIAAKQHYNSTGHYTVTGTASSNGQAYGTGVDITVKSATSIMMVDHFSGMAYGGAGALIWNLQYSTDGGSTFSMACGTDTYNSNVQGSPTTDTATSLMGSQNHQPNYGWAYDGNTWGPRTLRFFHDHNQAAGTTIRYRVLCYNNGASQTNYHLHANYMLMNFTVTEIGEIG